jgi:histidine ammonia-lyase
MGRIPDSGEAYDPVSMTTIVATRLRRIISNVN